VYLFSASPSSSTNGAVAKLAFTQLLDMQQQALAVLIDVAPYLSDQFTELVHNYRQANDCQCGN
jgi:hypothetical protein